MGKLLPVNNVLMFSSGAALARQRLFAQSEGPIVPTVAPRHKFKRGDRDVSGQNRFVTIASAVYRVTFPRALGNSSISARRRGNLEQLAL